jgi:hypothetical protein
MVDTTQPRGDFYRETPLSRVDMLNLASLIANYRTIFPQMTNCLPDDEGAQLRFDFETELARLKAA